MIRYTFIFDSEHQVSFEVDENSDTSVEQPGGPYEDWLLLDNFRCPECPIPTGARQTCPAALSVKPVVEGFKTGISYDRVTAVVEYGDIRMEVKTSLQQAVRSLVGLMMALSSCPVMRKLRPMAHFHLPFGDRERTLHRTLGMYLIAQCLRGYKGLESDWALTGLLETYGKIHKVNAMMADRMRFYCDQGDAAVNALVVLDMFGGLIEMSVEKHLEKLKPLFEMYL